MRVSRAVLRVKLQNAVSMYTQDSKVVVEIKLGIIMAECNTKSKELKRLFEGVAKLKKGPQVKLVKQKGGGADRVPKSNKGQVKACVIM